MAELNVQPKKNNPWWLWILLLLIGLGLLFFYLKGCNNKSADVVDNVDSIASNRPDGTANRAIGTTTATDEIDFNSPKAAYSEMADTSISVRGNSNYTIYSLGEDLLFDVDKSSIKGSAQTKLKQIASSLNRRFKGANIRIYGRTDSTGSVSYNKKLGSDRAEAVRSWLIKNAGIPDSQISVHSFGENKPLASNGTAEGKQVNRSVAIVAMPDKSAGNQQ